MTDWNNLLNSVNQKVIGIINSTTDSFTGDGVFENKERLGFLLKTAEEELNKPVINDQSRYLIDQKIEVLKTLN